MLQVTSYPSWHKTSVGGIEMVCYSNCLCVCLGVCLVGYSGFELRLPV